jgi:hypothetical protein
VKFYLSAHRLTTLPCPTDPYFVLERPERLRERAPADSLLRRLLTNSFRQNLALLEPRPLSPTVATAIEVAKLLPPLKSAVSSVSSHTAPSAQAKEAASRIEQAVGERGLERVECSTNLCWYKGKPEL